MTEKSTFYYVVSTYWYPSADQVDDEEVTMQVETVYPTMDKALDNLYEHVQCTCYPHADLKHVRASVSLFWDPVNNVMNVRTGGNTQYKFLISRVEMYDDYI